MTMPSEPERSGDGPERGPAWMWKPGWQLSREELLEYDRARAAGIEVPEPSLTEEQWAEIGRQQLARDEAYGFAEYEIEAREEAEMYEAELRQEAEARRDADLPLELEPEIELS